MRDCKVLIPATVKNNSTRQGEYSDMLKRPYRDNTAFRRKPYDMSITIKKKVQVGKEVSSE